MHSGELQFVGHATVYIDLDGTRLLTDPILRPRAAGLVHLQPPPAAITARQVDAVLISHLHHDHLDFPSLRLIPAGFHTYIGQGGAPLLRRHGFDAVDEMLPGASTRVGSLRIIATRADHAGFRVPAGPSAAAIGFVIEGSIRVYFAGDTDVFDDMASLRPIDVALLPLAGWGPRLGPGHMDPARAVQALQLLEPKVVVPIHWGSLAPWGLHRGKWAYLTRPAHTFATLAQRHTPNVEVRILQPGEVLRLSEAMSSLGL